MEVRLALHLLALHRLAGKQFWLPPLATFRQLGFGQHSQWVPIPVLAA
jgi:hypothetical protein